MMKRFLVAVVMTANTFLGSSANAQGTLKPLFNLTENRTVVNSMVEFNNATDLDLTVSISPVKSSQGNLIYTLFDSAESWAQKGDGIKNGTVPAVQGTDQLVITGIKPGSYALTIIHDENNNGKLDTNFLGMPQEMFGISKITQTLWSQPSWDEVKFEIKSGQKNQVDILLKLQ